MSKGWKADRRQRKRKRQVKDELPVTFPLPKWWTKISGAKGSDEEKGKKQ